LEDDDIDKSISEEEEEEVEPPPCGLLQASHLGSFESAHRESTTTVLHAIIILKQAPWPSPTALLRSWRSLPKKR
jgi:hypothetical protein